VRILAAVAVAVFGASAACHAGAPAAPGRSAYVARLRKSAADLRPIASSPLARRFLDAASTLPDIAPRKVYRDERTHAAFTAEQAAALAPDVRAKLTEVVVDEEAWYEAGVSNPLHYLRPLDLLGARNVALGTGSRVLDFGYGSIGHLRLLAQLGCDVTGIEVKPELLAYYSQPGDTGAVGTGRVRLFDGFFPTDAQLVSKVGSGYDLVIAKNTLKKGYIHPDRPAPDKWLIHLGVDDATFLRAFHDVLAARGRILLYNIFVPIPSDQPFKPMSDGRSPFTKEQWEAAGLVVEAIDEDDSELVRRMFAATHDDEPEPDGGAPPDFHALYTLVRRP
jgi:SAM-dependent methyltransferase